MDEGLVARYPELEKGHFWWATRRQLVRKLVVGSAPPTTKLGILDVGCGSGVTARSLTDISYRVVGVDLLRHSNHATDDPDGFELIVGDYLGLSAGLGQFDVVLALDAVEHFEDEGEVLKALSVNLRPGGKLLITVPAYPWLWSSHDLENHHYRRYTRRSLRTSVERAGLEVERIGYIFFALLLPKAVVKLIERSSRDRGMEIGRTPPGWLNAIAHFYFRLETAIAVKLTHFLPAGTSVLCVASKA